MLNLDDPKELERYDPSRMLEFIESLPEQCAAAKEIGLKFDLPVSFRSRYGSIVCAGVGGSAIGADIVRSYISDEAKTPILVNRSYILPDFVGEESLVVASSYSGDTEETLSAYEDARTRRAKIVAITSGGKLRAMAERDGFPVISIPKGIPPRCALGYSSFTLLALLSKTGLVEDKSSQMDDAIKNMRYMRDERIGRLSSRKNNPAKLIAEEIYLKFPVIYGAQDHIDSVVTRWRGQLAENSKTIASSNLLPELNHNEIVGWQNPAGVLKNFIVIMLKDPQDHPRVSKRMDITKKIITEAVKVRVIEVKSEGKGLLERMFSLIYTGDFVSYYLAVLNKLDPTPVERIAYLKERLAGQ